MQWTHLINPVDRESSFSDGEKNGIEVDESVNVHGDGRCRNAPPAPMSFQFRRAYEQPIELPQL